MEKLRRKQELTRMLDGVNQEIHRLRREAGWDITTLVHKARLTEQERTLLYDANLEAMSPEALFKMAVALGKKLEIRFVNRPGASLAVTWNALGLGKRVLRRPSPKEKRKALDAALRLQKDLNGRINHRR